MLREAGAAGAGRRDTRTLRWIVWRRGWLCNHRIRRATRLFTIPVLPPRPSVTPSPRSYNLLAVGTTDGRVMMYKFNQPNLNLEPVLDFAKCWEMQPAFFVSAGGGAP